MICNNCGYEMGGASFCPNCGFRADAPREERNGRPVQAPPFGQPYGAPQPPYGQPMNAPYPNAPQQPYYSQPYKPKKGAGCAVIFVIALAVLGVAMAIFIPASFGYVKKSKIASVRNSRVGNSSKSWDYAMNSLCYDVEWSADRVGGDYVVTCTGRKKSNNERLTIKFKADDRNDYSVKSVENGDTYIDRPVAIALAVQEIADGTLK